MDKFEALKQMMEIREEYRKSKEEEIAKLKRERDILRCSLEYLFEKKLVDKKFHDSYTLIEYVKTLYNA